MLVRERSYVAVGPQGPGFHSESSSCAMSHLCSLNCQTGENHPAVYPLCFCGVVVKNGQVNGGWGGGCI